MSFDPQPILSKLKPFQQATVDYVMSRFDAGAPRFLVADEVGLGKTRVAQGVVGLTLSRLPDEERADIIYVCSNSAIARQNLRLLNVLKNEEVNATRLTLLCSQGTGLSQNGANFIALTPGTSFDKSTGLGRAEERALLQKLLQGRFPTRVLSRLLRYPVQSSSRWSEYLSRVEPDGDRRAIVDVLLAGNMKDRIDACKLSDPAARGPIVRELLLRLARHALKSLRPKLVIFDEFQRFRNLFTDSDSEAQALMRSFLEAESIGARILFLSATPYKLLTLDREDAKDGDHHADFLKTIAVLYGSEGPAAAELLRQEIHQFRHHIRRFALNQDNEADLAKNNVEARLRRVVSRHERVASDSGDADIRRTMLPTTVLAQDLRQAKAVHAVARRLGAQNTVEYWKSAPYLFSFMGNYDLSRRIRTSERRGEFARDGSAAMIPEAKRRKFEPIPAGNGRMRALFEDVLEKTDLYRRLWLPAALPYLKGSKRLTKTLIFSDWQMVPEAVAALVSYEAERKLRQDQKFVDPPRKREPALLRLRTDRDQDGSSMRIMTLLYPSAFLARTVDPLAIWRAKGSLSPKAMQIEAEKLITAALKDLSVPAVKGNAPWQVLAHLDAGEKRWIEEVRKGLKAGSANSEKSAAERCLQEFIAESDGLRSGSPSKVMIKFLARVALGSPATCLLRAFNRHVDAPATARAFMAAQVAMGFLTLFNHREVRPLFVSDEQDGAWSRVLDYCAEQDLQAVLDEYVYQITNGWLTDERDEGKPAYQTLAQRVRETIGLRTAPITLHNPFERTPRSDRSMPSHLAARFAENVIQDREVGTARIDTLRDAFNSPFRPFVLASTSVGQEGLDFHLYCHRLWHWNIPSNPVDLEQREGRIQRYLNHAIRLNIAANHAEAARAANGPAWNAMLASAEAEVSARGSARFGLRPHWLYNGDLPDPVQIETILPHPPLSRDAQRAILLLRSTALYRLAFGQPRQSDLLAVLEAADIKPSEREKLLIRLAPPMQQSETLNIVGNLNL
ncbi:DEAD/DEAH box helicase family protein [Rhizobium ruizarguesonis]|uniref:hypothetical protein n=1 Tax=Rhizobium ruizarguesonis TaxID=2081791 RepID=UPI001FE1CE4F|nr:hypothetical protein [Rhizobium ruizarguesonis]